jgi:hypothetical protein
MIEVYTDSQSLESMIDDRPAIDLVKELLLEMVAAQDNDFGED